jgi:cytochrome P450 / NADPH-cytochrome P450 reductase
VGNISTALTLVRVSCNINMDQESVPIPQPPGLPVVGNAFEFDPEFPLGTTLRLADQYGEIFQLNIVGRPVVFLSSWRLVNEVCDEKRFRKTISAVLGQVRNGVHDGLFTAAGSEPNWAVAHRVLMPAFGPLAIRGMFDDMHDIASQLLLKWARHGAGTSILVTDDFTRLALDTIALCSMDYRFNSYYHDEMHPFVEAMGRFLKESGSRSRRPPFMELFYRQANQKYNDDIEVLRQTAQGVLDERKKHAPTGRKDLLTAMLEGADPKTGAKLSDSSIIDNLITFLIAGHETTSGLLSFAFYQLLKNPEAYHKAQEEVDRVLGTGPITPDHINKLHYIQAILRETLRLSATIPQIAVEPKEDTVLAGKYAVRKGQTIVLNLAKSQLDPSVYSDDAGEFVPERMLDAEFERREKDFPNSWKPFGNGMRACIGRPFAWQEATMVMALLFQNFNFFMDDPSYNLAIKQTLTIKPKDFYMRAALREGLTSTQLEHRLQGTSASGTPVIPGTPAQSLGAAKGTAGLSTAKGKGKPVALYYGSNSGTCESLAQRLASDAASHGFTPTVIDCLDATNQRLPTDQPVVIVTSSYEGQPPDNAAHFVSWLESLQKPGHDDQQAPLKGVSYAVFGCGHHDWAQTFHRIPKLVDSTIEKLGGTRIASLGLADAAEGDIFSVFETWEDSVLWPAMSQTFGAPPVSTEESETINSGGLEVEVTTLRTTSLRQDVREAVVIENRDLTKPGVSLKKHMEIQLPSGMPYSTGDYVAILPLNPKESVYRALRRFGIAWDAYLTINAAPGTTTLPTGTPMSASDILSAYVELAQPATKRGILTLSEATTDPDIKLTLHQLATEAYATSVLKQRLSILDLLDRYPSLTLPFATFLSLLPPMRVRQYSISSSPLWNPAHVTLTYSVLDAPAYSSTSSDSDPAGSRHRGVASTYLSSLQRGDKLHVAIRPSHAAFHLPVDAEHMPVICIAAGTGIAPFRGFVQERAAMIGAGRQLAPALLFFGTHAADKDDLYREEMDRWVKMGAVDVRRAYSWTEEAGVDAGEEGDAMGARHVQDRIWMDRREVNELYKKGAKVFVCGSRELGESVKKVALKIKMEYEREDHGAEMGEEEASKWFDGIRNERYATDVFD